MEVDDDGLSLSPGATEAEDEPMVTNQDLFGKWLMFLKLFVSSNFYYEQQDVILHGKIDKWYDDLLILFHLIWKAKLEAK